MLCSYVSAYDNIGIEHHYFLGGQEGENEQNGNFNNVVEYDAGSWTPRADKPFARGHASSSTLAYGCGLIIMAGATNGGGKTSTSDISYYSIPDDQWFKIGDLPESHNTPCCVVYTDPSSVDWLHCESPDGFSHKIRITA